MRVGCNYQNFYAKLSQWKQNDDFGVRHVGNIAINLLGSSSTTKNEKKCFYNPSWCLNWKLGHHPTMGGRPPSNTILHVKNHYPFLLALKWKVGCYQEARTEPSFWFLSQNFAILKHFCVHVGYQPVTAILCEIWKLEN